MMTTIFFINYLCFISACYFYAVPRMITSEYNIDLKKNPAWIKNNPEFLKRFPNPNLLIKISYLFGGLLILYLLYVAVSEHTPMALTKVFGLTATVLCLYMSVFVIFELRFSNAIPSPDSRVAELIPRGLQDYVPISSIYVAYIILFSILGIFIYGYMSSSLPAEVATEHIIPLASVLLILSAVHILSFKSPARKDNLMGETVRKYASYIYIFGLYFIVLGHIYVIAIYFFHIQNINLDKNWLTFFVSIFAQIIVVFIFNIKEMKRLVNEKPEDILGISQ